MVPRLPSLLPTTIASSSVRSRLAAMSSSLSSPAGTSPFTSSPHELPVIAIIGTTGVGKSKLSIQLAQHITSRYRHHHPESTSPDPSDSSSLPSSRHIAPAPSFNDAAFPPSFVSDPSPYGLPLPPSSSAWRSAEVINADSMQVYRGLDIITNKVTPDETEGVPHRLLGVVDPKAGERGWGMMKWVGHALEEVRLPRSSSSTVGHVSKAQRGGSLKGKLMSCCPRNASERHPLTSLLLRRRNLTDILSLPLRRSRLYTQSDPSPSSPAVRPTGSSTSSSLSASRPFLPPLHRLTALQPRLKPPRLRYHIGPSP
jgi:hypothetical protein